MRRSVLLVLVVVLAAMVLTTSFGAATVQQPDKNGAEHSRNAYPLDQRRLAHLSHVRRRTRTHPEIP